MYFSWFGGLTALISEKLKVAGKCFFSNFFVFQLCCVVLFLFLERVGNRREWGSQKNETSLWVEAE